MFHFTIEFIDGMILREFFQQWWSNIKTNAHVARSGRGGGGFHFRDGVPAHSGPFPPPDKKEKKKKKQMPSSLFDWLLS